MLFGSYLQVSLVEKKMKYLALLLLFVSQLSWADGQALNQQIIESFYTATEKMDNLETKYPDIFSELEIINNIDQIQAIKFVEQSKAYPDIKKVLSSSGFENLNELHDVALRIMGSIYSVQMKNISIDGHFQSVIQPLEENIKDMKQRGTPDSVINQMEEVLKENKAQQKEISLAVSKASEEDKEFVSNNLDWIMSLIPDETDEDDENY